jgi:hypothetical protein
MMRKTGASSVALGKGTLMDTLREEISSFLGFSSQPVDSEVESVSSVEEDGVRRPLAQQSMAISPATEADGKKCARLASDGS